MAHDFRARLRRRETLVGTLVSLPAAASAEILAGVGFDWLFIDGEHAAIETRELAGILQAVGHRLPCLVRVAAAAEVPVTRALDLGADGVIVPQVDSAAQAVQVVRWARYPPDGSRGVGLGRAQGYGVTLHDYLATANREVAVVVQAESARAVEEIEAIVRVPGVDAVLLGPYDLSASLGRMGEAAHPVVVEAIDRVIAACQAAGMPIGCFGMTAAAVQPFIARGCTLVVAGSDALHLATGAAALLRELRPAR
jgi:2-keto-3-deoxy-L-rhamnonate aldolase RhmA